VNTARTFLSALALAGAFTASAQEPKREPAMTVEQVTEHIRKYNDDYIAPMSERREVSLYGEALRRETDAVLKAADAPLHAKYRELAYDFYRRGEKEKIPALRQALFVEARRYAYEGVDDVLSRLATGRLGGDADNRRAPDIRTLETKAEAQKLVEWCLRMDGEFSALKRYDVARRYIAVAREASAYIKDASAVMPRIQEREKALEELAKTVVEKFEDSPTLAVPSAPEIELKGAAEIPTSDGPPVPVAQVMIRKRVDGRIKAKLFLLRKGDLIGDGDLATQCRVTDILKADDGTPEKGPATWELRYRDADGNEKAIRAPRR
jgi:hypothetical protein